MVDQQMPLAGVPPSAPAPKARPLSGLFPTLIVGVAIGSSLGPALFVAVDRLDLSGEVLIAFLVGCSIALSIAVTLGLLGAIIVVPRLLSRARGSLVAVVDHLTAAGRAHSDGDKTVALQHVGDAAAEAVAWYSIGATRRFAVQTALGILISFGGLVGVALLFAQNSLMRTQNDMFSQQNKKIDQQLILLSAQNAKIDLQTLTAEAQRRGNLSPELFAILQLVSDLPRPKILKEDSALLSRIVTFTRSATPYWIVETHLEKNGDISEPRRATRPRSPERGQLLIGLLLNGLSLNGLGYTNATFANADLRQANVAMTDLRTIDLSQADLAEAELENANLSEADLEGANLAGAKLLWANLFRTRLNKANLTGANLHHADLSGAILNEANLDGANMTGVRLQNASLYRANLMNANLIDVDLSTANLSNADLTNAIIAGKITVGSPNENRFAKAPSGWVEFDDGPNIRLRRVRTSP